MKKIIFRTVCLIAFSLLALFCFSQNNSQSATSRFHSVNTSILQLFEQYPIVAIGEGQHNSALTFEWLHALINEEIFPDVVNNIVVEFGASEYQWVMDAYTSNKEVPDSLFKKCWRETTQIMVWDNPIYEQFFKEIRKRNIALPENKRLRVLLGDPTFGSEENRDEHAFRTIEKEVLQKKQTALLIYGDLHFVRKDIFTNYTSIAELKKEYINVVQWMEKHYPGKTFAIWGSVNTQDSLTGVILQNEQIQIPAFIRTADSRLGDIDFRIFYPYPTGYRTDGAGIEVDESVHVQMPMSQIVDGILFRGSWEDQNYLAPRPDDIYADTAYLNELIRREKTVNIPPYRTRLYFHKIFESNAFDPFEKALDKGDAQTIVHLYQPIKMQVPDDKQAPVLNYAGHFFLRKGETQKAIRVLELAIREYGDTYYLYDTLGDVYLATQEMDKARESFEKALNIDPNHTAIRTKLNKIK